MISFKDDDININQKLFGGVSGCCYGYCDKSVIGGLSNNMIG